MINLQNQSHIFECVILWSKRRKAAVMNMLESLYKTSFWNISNNEIFPHAIMNIACNRNVLILSKIQSMETLTWPFPCVEEKYLQTQYIKGPKTIKSAEEVPEWPGLNIIWFASSCRFCRSTFSSLIWICKCWTE
jgi:hypothetical protein